MNPALRLLAVAALLAAPAAAHEETAPAHTFVLPADIQWGPPPPALPPGSKIAVLKGDPGEEGPFTLRAWLPAGYVVKPHWHPTSESVTVISGEGFMGMGDTLDQAQGHALPAGSFAYVPAAAHHSFWVETETVIQVQGMGPFMIFYLNPADDPRNAPAP